MHMKGGEYTVYNWNDVDSPSVEVRRTVQTLTMEVGQIMKVWRQHSFCNLGSCCAGRPPAITLPAYTALTSAGLPYCGAPG